jgi:antitoxin (DNA-binding transcriptional repressor) of toxin-antitoxin stability system
MTAELSASQLADLVRKVQAGNEVIVMDKNQAVAKLVPANNGSKTVARSFKMRTFADRKVLTPSVSQQELAEEMFERK